MKEFPHRLQQELEFPRRPNLHLAQKNNLNFLSKKPNLFWLFLFSKKREEGEMAIPLYDENCYKREIDVEKPDTVFRPPFRRDYSRLIHSPSFRRLQGKTQLYPGHESDFFRNRLTHSLEVAQIAKGIAQRLNHEEGYLKIYPIDLDLVEFAALAHDLGHPPFGHNGERALDDCMKEAGGFEGNAQTLRLLAITEKKQTTNGAPEGILADGTDQRKGLNLTYRSLAAILKYDHKIPSARKQQEKLEKGYYDSEEDLIKRIKSAVAPGLQEDRKFKTIECQIMDLADDIAYSTYDLEDGLKGGFVDPLMLIATLRSNQELLERVVQKVKRECSTATNNSVIGALAQVFGFDIEGNPEEQQSPLETYDQAMLLTSNGYLRSELTSTLVSTFISGVKFELNEERPYLSKVWIDENIKLTIETLKHLNFELTIMSPRLKLVEYRGYEIVKSIFKSLTSDDGHLLLPLDVKQQHTRLADKRAQLRLVSDFVAGMTDRYAIEFYGRLKNGEQSIFKPF